MRADEFRVANPTFIAFFPIQLLDRHNKGSIPTDERKINYAQFTACEKFSFTS